MKKFNTILLIILLCVGVIFSQKYSFENQKEVFQTLEDNPLFVPNAEKIQKFTFGFDNLITNLIWLKTVQYIGGNARSGNYELLYEYLDSVTDLDPEFYMPYFIAQLLLPEIQQADKAILISEKGLKNLPERWEVPYYMGYIYYYYLEDYEKGAEKYWQASKMPGVLSSATRMAINLTSKNKKHLLALEMWINAYEEEKNPQIKELIAKKIRREENFVELEHAVQKYYENYGLLPENLNELIRLGFITEIPKDPIESHKEYQLEEGLIFLR